MVYITFITWNYTDSHSFIWYYKKNVHHGLHTVGGQVKENEKFLKYWSLVLPLALILCCPRHSLVHAALLTNLDPQQLQGKMCPSQQSSYYTDREAQNHNGHLLLVYQSLMTGAPSTWTCKNYINKASQPCSPGDQVSWQNYKHSTGKAQVTKCQKVKRLKSDTTQSYHHRQEGIVTSGRMWMYSGSHGIGPLRFLVIHFWRWLKKFCKKRKKVKSIRKPS